MGSEKLEHAAEPWNVRIGGEEGEAIVSSMGRVICQADHDTVSLGDLDKQETSVAYARIVSCVNACKGLPNSVLDAGLVTEFARAACSVALILPQARQQLKREIGLLLNAGAPPKFRPALQAKAKQLTGIAELLVRVELLAVGALALAQKNGLDIQIDDKPKSGVFES